MNAAVRPSRHGAARRLPLLLASVLPLWAAAPAVAQTAPAPDSLSLRVDALFSRWHRPDSPGASVLVMKDGAVVHARGYGMANLEHGVPIRTSTVFDIASVSKQFAAFAILMLDEAGTIGLDDDVRIHIPEFPEFGSTITIRHLVHHTSGLRDWPGTLRMAGWDYMDVLSFEQILTMARHQRDLNFPPGSEYAYSNTGYNLLAEVVSRATGVPFAEWTRAHIFEPLGMKDTHFHDDHTRIVTGRAESYAPRAEGGFRRVVSSLTALGSSSLFTTVDDLARWVRNFDNATVGGESVIARFHQRGVLADGTRIRYAFGVNVDEDGTGGASSVSHTGSWAGYRSILIRYPAQGLAIVILANSSDVETTRLAEEIARIYGAAPGSAAPAGLVSPAVAGASTGQRVFHLSEPDLEAYVGEYHSPELLTSYRISVRDGRLVAEHFRVAARGLEPLGPDLFRGDPFGRIDFTRDSEGCVTGFLATSERVRGVRFERVPN